MALGASLNLPEGTAQPEHWDFADKDYFDIANAMECAMATENAMKSQLLSAGAPSRRMVSFGSTLSTIQENESASNQPAQRKDK